MPANVSPGWYASPDGATEVYHDGSSYTDQRRRVLTGFGSNLLPTSPPNADDRAAAGWYPDHGDSERWWTGSRWSPARRDPSGRRVIQEGVGQALLSAQYLNVKDEDPIARLHAALDDWPPCRIVSVRMYPSATLVSGKPVADVVALIEWD